MKTKVVDIDPIMKKFLKKVEKLSEKKKEESKSFTEKEVKQRVVRYLKKKGWEVFTVYLGGIPTRGNRLASNPLKGFPDLICTHKLLKSMFYIELKRSKGGVVSDDQAEWHERLRICGQKVLIVRSVDDLKKEGI